MPYSTDEDLVVLRPKIMEKGVAKWDDQRTIAEDTINGIIERQWYRPEAQHLGVDWRDVPFNAALMLNANTQLKMWSCYATLELAYLHLMKDAPEPDAYERQRSIFEKLKAAELRAVLADGIDYDWNSSGALASEETKRPARRRLSRC